jgi:hypothetical protein
MFYPAFAAIPEWAPPGENHILYSQGVLKEVSYEAKKIQYTSTDATDSEYLRLAFRPTTITVDGSKLSFKSDPRKEGYTLRDLGNGDFALTIQRTQAGKVVIR